MAGSRSTRATPPQPTVSTASAGGGTLPRSLAGLATIRLTTTERTEDSPIASVEVDV